MTTTFRVHASELDQDFFERLKAMFNGKEIEIIVHEKHDMDETDYLLSDPENRTHILDSHARVGRREGLVEVDINSL
ncbi:MAG: hypothetical protein WCH46_00870 [bacterium]